MERTAQSAFERFDMSKRPKRQSVYLRPLIWALSYPSILRHRVRISRVNMDGQKPPYLLLCNHNAFLDFMVATAAIFPHRANYVVAIDGFIKRERLLRSIGCICKRKFTSDTVLVRQLRTVIDNGDIAVIYPEARYSLCGTTAVLPPSLGKLAKYLKVPVVTLITHGHHINSPFWNLKGRGIRTEAVFKKILTGEEVESLTSEEINAVINREFQYDDYRWQKENNIRVRYKKRAEGLHKVLYQCPNCKTEYRITSRGDRLRCGSCGKEWVMTELGELRAVNGETEFSHIPDWYEWERAQVRAEVNEGRYGITVPVEVESLPNAKGFIPLGRGVLTHDMNGFLLKSEYRGEPYTLVKTVKSLYSCHIEYNYLGKHGDCIDLNTLSDTYYIYPQGCDFSVTKMALATEELYAAATNKERAAVKA